MNRTIKTSEIKLENQKEKENGRPKAFDLPKTKTEKGIEKENEAIKIKAKYKLAEKGIDAGGSIIEKIIDIFGYFKAKEQNKTQDISSLEKELKESNDSLKKKNEELEEIIKKLNEKMGEDEQKRNEGNKEWNQAKDSIIDRIIKEIDYIKMIKQIIEKSLEIFEKDISEELTKILNERLQDNSIIKEKHNLLFKEIKGDMKEVKTFNFMIIGYTGVGKSCLTNAILNKEVAKEGKGIKPETDTIKQFDNPEEPGITIYDTIGIESTNIERSLDQIKEKVEKAFIENLENPEKSLHGILYCINNGSSQTRIENGEIEFILGLNRLYGENDILIIVFTQSLNERTEERKKELRDYLKNDKIEIIDVLAKDFHLKLGKFEHTIPAYGIPELKEVMMEKCKNKLVKCNLKQIVKKKIKDKFNQSTAEDYNKLISKINSKEFEPSLREECERIVKSLVGNIDINFYNLNDILTRYTNKDKMEEIKKELLEKNKSAFYDELFEEFNDINQKYGNKLTNFSMKEIFGKFGDYFNNNISKDIVNIYFEKASLIFIEKCKEFFGEIIGTNVRDEDIENLVNSSLNNKFKVENKN